MPFLTWQDELFAQFRLFGLPRQFDERELRNLHRDGFTPKEAYGVACDLYAGFDIETARIANKAH